MFAKSLQATERGAQFLQVHDEVAVHQDGDIRSVHIPPPVEFQTESPAIGSDVTRRRSVFRRSLRNTTCVIDMEEVGPNRTLLAVGYHRSVSDDIVRADRALHDKDVPPALHGTIDNPCSAIPSVASSDRYRWRRASRARSVIWYSKNDVREDPLSGDAAAQLRDLFGAACAAVSIHR